MRESEIESSYRNWSNEGYAIFSDIIRTENDDLSKLCRTVTKELSKYTEASQCGIFVEKEGLLEMKSCFAYSREKFQQKTIEKGDGLIGEVWQEGEKFYMTEIPTGYMDVRSGLGSDKPASLYIVPLESNERICGVLEIASMKKFEKHELEFIDRVCETLASSIISVSINEETKQLYEESQQLTQELQAQEKEMRQNFEELQATQEELGRKEKEYLAKIDELESKLV